MGATEDYVRGVAAYAQGLYSTAQKSLMSVAQGGDLLGRLGRYYLGRAFRAAAIDAAIEDDFSTACDTTRQAAEIMGPTAELAGYLAGIYCRDVTAQRQTGSEPDPAEVAADTAIAQARAGMGLEALMTARQGIRAHPTSSPLQLVAGMILAGQDRLDEAREHFKLAAERDCACGEAYRYLGLCDVSEGRFGRAVAHLSRALSLRPGDLSLMREVFSIARAAAHEGQPIRLKLPDDVGSATQEDLDRLAQRVLWDNDFLMAALDLPAGSADTEIFGVLAEVLDVVLAAHGEYADVQYRRGLIHQRLGRSDQALTCTLKALAINPGYVQARFFAGSLLLEVDPAAAADHLRRAVADGGDYADVHAALGEAYQRLGRLGAARRALTRSLEINADYAPAAEALKRLAA